MAVSLPTFWSACVYMGMQISSGFQLPSPPLRQYPVSTTLFKAMCHHANATKISSQLGSCGPRIWGFCFIFDTESVCEVRNFVRTTHLLTVSPRNEFSDPVVKATDAKTSRILLIAVILLHAGLSLTIKILFFQ